MNLPEEYLLSHVEYHDDGVQSYSIISDDNMLRDKAEQLDKYLKVLGKGKSLPFTVSYDRKGYKPHTSASLLRDVICCLERLQKDYLRTRLVNPRIAAFQRLLNNADLCARIHEGKIVGVDQITTAESLNKLILDYRTAISQAGFKKEYLKYKRASIKNLKGVLNYLRHMQSRYSRLLILRVDLSWNDEHKSDVTADIARQCRQHLFRNMKKNPLFRNVLGTVWKLEYAPARKFHYHMLFLVNGHKARQDVNLARAFGEYWKKHITESKGHYYNCNAHKDDYEDCGLGKLERGNSSMEKGLLKAVSYMTKIDACARLVLPGNARTFGRGEIKALKTKNKRRR